jgi:hypothetical protein
MNHRKLRIAWSVAWGIMTASLVALWVRSYWRTDVLLCGGIQAYGASARS